ncbi:MAG: dTDP-4-dehydrorhamnose reductase [Balneolaceae bacterium]
MKKLLVTGAGGQLGREWMESMAQSETLFGPEGSLQVPEIVGCGSAELDITDRPTLREKLDREQPDLIVNCAAWTDVDGAQEHPDDARRVNRDGVFNLAEWCAGRGAILVHYSTDYIFAGTDADRLTYPGGYPEEAPASPVNLYGESKLAGEQELERSGAPYLLIRVSWLCGAHGQNFVKTMLELGKAGKPLRVVDDQWGSPAYCTDVVLNTIRLLQARQRGVWHLSSRGVTTWYHFAEAIFEEAGIKADLIPVTSEEYPRPAPRPTWSKLETGKLEAMTETRLPEWRAGLRTLLDRL